MKDLTVPRPARVRAGEVDEPTVISVRRAHPCARFASVPDGIDRHRREVARSS